MNYGEEAEAKRRRRGRRGAGEAEKGTSLRTGIYVRRRVENRKGERDEERWLDGSGCQSGGDVAEEALGFGHAGNELAEGAVLIVLLELGVGFGVFGLEAEEFVGDFFVDLVDGGSGDHVGAPGGGGLAGVLTLVQKRFIVGAKASHKARFGVQEILHLNYGSARCTPDANGRKR